MAWIRLTATKPGNGLNRLKRSPGSPHPFDHVTVDAAVGHEAGKRCVGSPAFRVSAGHRPPSGDKVLSATSTSAASVM
jgi:hypothetical protein